MSNDSENRETAVYRQDDNGACALKETFPNETEAREFLEKLEARGHKQFYWLEPFNQEP